MITFCSAETLTGDGLAMAYRAGLALKDMEFVQFHPTGLIPSGILMTEACRGEGGTLLNSNGDRFMGSYAPSKMELAPRDMVSRSEMTEIEAGRGFPGPEGLDYIHLDLRHLGRERILERLPLIREVTIKHIGLDPIEKPLPIRPVAHYSMGGVHTDIKGHTPAKNIWAAGEVSCVSLHGANRLGSNSTAECWCGDVSPVKKRHVTKGRRPFIRFFACGQDWSHEPLDDPLPEAIATGAEPQRVVGAMAGG